MKCPVSMLPTGGISDAPIIFVIGVIVSISYILKAQQNQAAATKNVYSN